MMGPGYRWAKKQTQVPEVGRACLLCLIVHFPSPSCSQKYAINKPHHAKHGLDLHNLVTEFHLSWLELLARYNAKVLWEEGEATVV